MMRASGVVELERLAAEPAPFLPLLHAVQDRFGCLPRAALEEVADLLRMPLAEVFGAASFYHYFKVGTEAPSTSLACNGPACALRSGYATADGIPCPGRCDLPGVHYDGLRFEPFETPLPPPADGPEFFFRHLRERRPWLADYRARGGYRDLDRSDVVERLQASGLTGRGGAGFPAAAKWRAVREASGGPKVVICNADEGEPGCFKDRTLLDHDPHAVLEGLCRAGRAVGAAYGLIYLRYEYPQTLPILARAIAEARDAGLLEGFPVHVRRGAGAYICGEETALLNSLEGKRPFPRERPPYPTTRGLFGAPTLVHNVETLAALPWILGRDTDVPTRLFSVSGDVERPGNYEVLPGTPLRDLLVRRAGARRVKAVTMAGISGGFLGGAALDVTLDPAALQAVGSTLGSGGIVVYDDTRCLVRAAAVAMRFFARESCGKCFPCRIGTVRLAEHLDAPRAEGVEDAARVAEVMAATSACGLGLSAPSILRSLVKFWPDDYAAHQRGTCPAGECRA